MAILAIFLGLIFAYSLVSVRIERTWLTAPIVFTVAGILAGSLVPEPSGQQIEIDIFLVFAELGLVMLLFTDGSRVSHPFRGGLRSVPGRLLSVGMVLTIALGLLVALVVFGGLSIWQAGILAAILAPTDAGLGAAIVSDTRVPRPIRESLNVEAGLNDGLSVPFLLFFIAMAADKAGADSSLSRYFMEQFGYGTVIGLLVGGLGGRLFAAAIRNRTIGANYRQLGFAALPMMCVLASEVSGASMFIAAFVAGLATRSGPDRGRVAQHSVKFIEDWGQTINLAVFFMFGQFVAREWSDLTAAHVLYAVLSLTVIRMLPVALALMGTGFNRSTVLFMGWFGPRGLASIVLGLVYLQNAAEQDSATIRLAVIATVLISIVAHGLSAKPAIRRYAHMVEGLPPGAAEKAHSSGQ